MTQDRQDAGAACGGCGSTEAITLLTAEPVPLWACPACTARLVDRLVEDLIGG